MKPRSQVNDMLFGKVVSRPLEEPFIGTESGPQSFAKIQACTNSIVRKCLSPLFGYTYQNNAHELTHKRSGSSAYFQFIIWRKGFTLGCLNFQ